MTKGRLLTVAVTAMKPNTAYLNSTSDLSHFSGVIKELQMGWGRGEEVLMEHTSCQSQTMGAMKKRHKTLQWM